MVFNTILDRISSPKDVTMEDAEKAQQIPYTILFLGEFLGTAVLMYIGCMGCVLEFPGGPILPAFAFGFAILASVQIVGHITGCHMNPAISLGILILGKMKWKEFIVYLPGQYLGAIAGYAALKVMMPDGYQICLLKLANGVNSIQAFFIEFTVTCILMLVVAGSMDSKNSTKVDSSPLRIGFTVSGFIFAAAPFTSAALNPARSLPPSLLYNHWDYHWIFHAGPFLGAITAAFVYRYVFEETEVCSVYKITQKRKYVVKIARETRTLRSVRSTVHHIFKIVDRQFSQQNGVSVAVLPTPNSTPTPEPKWITPEVAGKYALRKEYQIDDDLTTLERTVLCLGEILGTAVLVFLGCMGCVTGMSDDATSPGLISLNFGLAIMISVQIFGHISGCHINPMVTVAAATIGNIPLVRVPIFIVGQLLGGLAGFGLIKVVTPAEALKPKLNVSVGPCSPNFHDSLSPVQALMVEFLLSLILVWACCSAWDGRNGDKNDSTPIRLGLTVAGLAVAGGPYTGAHMNPARSFAPALINGDWSYHWVYWVGPLCAGFFGALFYKFVFFKDPMTSNETYPETSVEKT